MLNVGTFLGCNFFKTFQIFLYNKKYNRKIKQFQIKRRDGIYEKINKRFEELKKDWESKVHKRYIHLIDNNEKYNIKKTFKYLIVTKYPEILSHDSDYLVLTIDEFNFYLQNDFQFSNFRDLCDELYKHKKLDEQEIIKLMKVLNCKIK